MKEKNDSKIISIRKYLRKKEQMNKLTATGEMETSVTDKEKSNWLSSNVIDISFYLKTKGLDEKKQKKFLKNKQEDKLGKIISFSQNKRNNMEQESNQKFSESKQDKSSIIFLEDYLERKKIPNHLFNQNFERKKKMHIKTYRPMGWVAAALLAVFSISIFYQQQPENSFQGVRGLANEGESLSISSEEMKTPINISAEEIKTLSYREYDRTPQSLYKKNLDHSEYIKYLRQNQNSIKVKGEKLTTLNSIDY